MMNMFTEKDSEFAGLVRKWLDTLTDLRDAEYRFTTAKDMREEAKHAAMLAEVAVRAAVISNGYPIVVPYGQEGQGVLYSVNRDTGAVETRHVTVTPPQT